MPDYYSLPTARLENDYLTLDYLTDRGPRIVRLIPRGLGQNLMAETPEAQLRSPYGPCRLWGGHRLWHAPETAGRTYIPDDGGLTIAPLPGVAASHGISLTYQEAHSGIHKELQLRLAPDAARVEVIHRLTNTGLWPIELAPWAITQLKVGGRAVLPVSPAADAEGLLPNRLVALWPYSRWDDPRLRLTEAAIEIDARPMAMPFKIGYLNRDGWLEYHYEGVVFRKRFAPQPDRPHVDFGCNTEAYTHDKHIELETLGPLTRLAVGEMVEHVEVWEVEESL
jgi:hypothetical protein